jgi:hypothetical protein
MTEETRHPEAKNPMEGFLRMDRIPHIWPMPCAKAAST